MRQVLQDNMGAVVIRDVARPACAKGNVVVRNEYSAISSGTERARLRAAQKSLMRRVQERPEVALKVLERVRRDGPRATRDQIRSNLSLESPSGYSCAGAVIEVGTAVRGIAIGDQVACAGAGYANHAELVSVPSNLCARVPTGVAMPSAALTTIAAIALHGVRLGGVSLGDRVAVVGCGLVGQIASRLLVAAGATVFALDIDPQRVSWATESGAHHGFAVDDRTAASLRQATGGAGADAVFVTAASSSADPLVLATEIARDRAAVVLVGDVPIDLPRAALFERELSFRVSRSYGPGRYDPEYEERGLDYPIGYVRWTEQRNMACVLELQAQGALDLGDLVDDVVPIDDAAEAYARLAGPAAQRPRGAIVFSYPASSDRRTPPVPRKLRAARGGAVRVGLIGPGAFARAVLIPHLAQAGAALVAVTGGSGVNAEATARTARFERIADTEADLITAPDVDAVIIATRHESHARLAAACLDAGKHVFCEKPLALDRGQLDEVLASARRADRVLAVDFNRRAAPHVVRLTDFVAGRREPLVMQYRVHAGSVPPQHWTSDLEQGGGRLVGEGCHFVDLMRHVADSEIVTVHAAGFGDQGRPVGARDNVVITLTFADGSVGALIYSAAGAPGLPKERLEVHAGDRTAVLDDFVSLDLYDGRQLRQFKLRSQDKGHAATVRRFLASVQTGADPIALETVGEVHLACFAAIDSLRTGLALPPSGIVV